MKEKKSGTDISMYPLMTTSERSKIDSKVLILKKERKKKKP